jgi:hypothetical protein
LIKSGASDPTVLKQRTVILACVLWGDKFRRDFLAYCLPSLLAPGNLPALSAFGSVRFLIAAPRDDYAALAASPVFETASRFAAFERLALPKAAAFKGPTGKMRRMSAGHRLAVSEMFTAGAYGTFIYPDTVFANGAMRRLVAAAGAGDEAVLALCPRFANERFLAALESQRGEDAAAPIALDARTLFRLALPAMHSETRRYDVVAPFFADRPVMIYQAAADGAALIFHSTNWTPLLLDYARLEEHDAATLEDWTIDGDYIWRNWPNPESVRLLGSTDEAGMVSFTREADVSYLPLRRECILSMPGLANLYRRLVLRRFLHSDEIDPLKREQFLVPIEVRLADGDPVALAVARRHVGRLAESVKDGPLTHTERRLLTLLIVINEGIIRHFQYWLCHRKKRVKCPHP